MSYHIERLCQIISPIPIVTRYKLNYIICATEQNFTSESHLFLLVTRLE